MSIYMGSSPCGPTKSFESEGALGVCCFSVYRTVVMTQFLALLAVRSLVVRRCVCVRVAPYSVRISTY